MDSNYIEDIFSYHPPKSDKVSGLHESVRYNIKLVARYINARVPESPEKTLAIRHLQQAMMYANAAIAINQE